MDEPTKDENDVVMCAVAGCSSVADYDLPDTWCAAHWNTWWDWPPEKDDEAPGWIKAVNDDVERLGERSTRCSRN